jgi:hypothetical protein
LRKCPAPSLNLAKIMPGGRGAGRARRCTRRTLQQVPRNSRQNSRPDQANKLISHCYALGAHLSAAHFPGAAHLLVPVTSRAFPRMIRRIPPWFPIWPRLVMCPSPRGGGSIRSGLDITPSHCAQYAQAQEDQQKTCHHIQAPCTKPCCKMQWEKRPGARHCGGSSGAAPACRWSLPTRSVYRGL